MRYKVTLGWAVGGDETVECDRIDRRGDELVLTRGRGPGQQVRRVLVDALVEYVVVRQK